MTANWFFRSYSVPGNFGKLPRGYSGYLMSNWWGIKQSGSDFEQHKLAPAQHSHWQGNFFLAPDDQFVNLLIYQCAKLGALNQRIRVKETRSGENRPGLLSPVQPPKFSKLPTFWLSDLSSVHNGHQRPSWTTANSKMNLQDRLWCWPRALTLK